MRDIKDFQPCHGLRDYLSFTMQSVMWGEALADREGGRKPLCVLDWHSCSGNDKELK